MTDKPVNPKTGDSPMSLEDMRKAALDSVEPVAARKLILDARKQRVVWARLTTIKRLLIRRGITTDDEFENMAGAMVNDINNKIIEKVKKDLGLEEDGTPN